MKRSSPGEIVLGFRIKADLLARLDRMAEADQRSRSQMARLLIEDALSRQEKRLSGLRD